MESRNDVDETLIHISHLHPLRLVRSPEPRPICNACNMPCAGQSYSCTDCWYFLHVTCATIRRSMDHHSHPAHTLELELNQPYAANFTCDACGEDGTYTFRTSCRECNYDLHLHCAAIPHKINHRSHSCHPLFLVYENQYPSGFICDICDRQLDVDKWFYLCERCDFGGHIECFLSEHLEVLSPGLQVPETPPESPPQAHQPASRPQAYRPESPPHAHQLESPPQAYPVTPHRFD
ncbi:hypothetical protein LUZ63_009735 [Rhynchospora breviuscula]|uniref:DC1 domain-containing protein n=1 Tax=Rhynchospora breviuscula TaxID=2022672 RepID=A0A9Q0CG18_9POAL|nr:hypothetical protein LUZ63_009735 [Rhynchospora breviuscula]